ncbi:metal-dependent transcriptional regulator [Schumannella sp. 10F1B-5-1]|uniref:metal-dependent transcriptional regulator n=1 Tax=Schumannella sp. 10F1B-5-1 TaxID=2590780 RepID=UPI0011328116|nr:metal-dependent transcriptional regulator [Schumannella sp. 10F1B-5-1]TPW73182.1 metal-dependent transcriptional regulator [Schumannella sp. 10F1B-5-1]
MGGSSGGGARVARTSSEVVEDYLKVIYGHTEWQDDPITPKRLGERLGLSPSSVTETVKRLAAQGLVEHARYGAITLTPAGEAEALRMVRRHRLVETWLVQEFGYGWDEVHDEAEVLEHALSDRMLDAIDARLGHPVRDPHGDPIPDAQGAVPASTGLLVAEVTRGVAGRVVRISDEDPAVLRELADAGVGLDSSVRAGELSVGAENAMWVVVEPAG